MKLLLLILGFAIQNKSVVWQKTYHGDATALISHLRTSGSFTDIQVSDSVITARIENLEADLTGTTRMRAPIYIVQSFINAAVVIEYGSGSYTVSVKKIMLEQTVSNGLSRQGEKSSIETYALAADKTDFRNTFKKNAAPILDQTFQNLFELPH